MSESIEVDNRSKQQKSNGKLEYQFLLESIRNNQGEWVSVHAHELERIVNEYVCTLLEFERHADAIAIQNKQSLFYLKYSGSKKESFLKVYVRNGNLRRVVKDVRVVRSRVYVNNIKTECRYSNADLAANFTRISELEMTVKTLCRILLPQKGISIMELRNAFENEYCKYCAYIDGLDDAIFHFNKVGGEFTKRYKLFSKFKLDKRLANPFLALGDAAFFQVYGGNPSKGIRFSRSISKLPGVAVDTKLTRESIRKARLKRFEKLYIIASKPIMEHSKNALIHKTNILKVIKVIKQWQRKTN